VIEFDTIQSNFAWFCITDLQHVTTQKKMLAILFVCVCRPHCCCCNIESSETTFCPL